MEAVIIGILVAVLALVAIYLAAIQRRPGPEAEQQRSEQLAQRLEQQLLAAKAELTQAVSTTQQSIQQHVQGMDERLSARFNAVQSDLNQSLTASTQEIGRIGEQLGELRQSTQQMMEIGRNISSLQDILKPPKLRGGFGELLLERLLAEILSDQHFTIQHRFPSGVQVDAAIHVGHNVVPVDSKFPLEAFNRMAKANEAEQPALRKEFVRAVKGHIDAVAKYILPDEGSLPFALMYIPAENVYYEVIVKDDIGEGQANLCAYAMERRVIPVSPSSFYAYLQAILIGLRGMKVEAHAQEIIRHVERLSGDFTRIRKDFGTLGSHLKNASDRYGDIDRAVNKFGDRLQLTLNEPLQAPLPEADIAPAPLGLPQQTNGHDQDDLSS